MGAGAGILLLAAIGLFLIQSPDSPLPWEEITPTSSDTAIPPSPTATETLVPTSTGTRRPTRTAALLSDTPAPTSTKTAPSSPTPAATTALPSATHTAAAISTATATQAPPASSPTPSETPLPPTVTDTPEPAATTAPTATLSPTPMEEPILVTGRVVDQDTPIAGVTITLEGLTVLTTVTDANGAYQFQVDWVDEYFSVVFSLESNPQLSPSSNYVAWSWIEGLLAGDIEIPDLEISAAPKGDLFEQTLPVDGSSYSAAQISFDTPITFEWADYPQAEQYWVDLGRQGEEDPVWGSLPVIDELVDFDGKLNNGAKISEGTYWWAVGTLRSAPGFRFMAYTQNWTLVITP